MSKSKCSFCGLDSEDVMTLIDSGNNATICDKCVMTCLRQLVYKGKPTIIKLGENELSKSDKDEISITGC